MPAYDFKASNFTIAVDPGVDEGSVYFMAKDGIYDLSKSAKITGIEMDGSPGKTENFVLGDFVTNGKGVFGVITSTTSGTAPNNYTIYYLNSTFTTYYPELDQP